MINLILHILYSTCRIAHSTLHILHRDFTHKIHSTFYFAISVYYFWNAPRSSILEKCKSQGNI